MLSTKCFFTVYNNLIINHLRYFESDNDDDDLGEKAKFGTWNDETIIKNERKNTKVIMKKRVNQ